MRGSQFDEAAFFAAIRDSGARALVIGRRALVFLGLPVMTADYDFWLHIDDMELFNAAVEPFDLHPSPTPEEARREGRYVLSNGEHVDVLVARTVPTVDGVTVTMEDVWSRRQMIRYAEGIDVAIPSIDDLIATKRFTARPKDLEDIRLLEFLREDSRARQLVSESVSDRRGTVRLYPPGDEPLVQTVLSATVVRTYILLRVTVLHRVN